MNERLTRRELLLVTAVAVTAGCRRGTRTAETDAARKETGSATVTLVVDGMI